MRIPAKITQGDSLTWDDSSTVDNLGNTLSAPDWTLKYAFRGASVLDLTAQQDGDGWSTSISSAQTIALTPGFYYWQAYVEKDSERKTLGSGRVEILKNLASISSGTYDGRTQARQDLDAVQAAMRAMISGGAVQEYTIGNRSFRKMSLEDLRTLESQLKYAVALEEKEEKIKAGLGDPMSLFVRF
jgi:hypothetical protein